MEQRLDKLAKKLKRYGDREDVPLERLSVCLMPTPSEGPKSKAECFLDKLRTRPEGGCDHIFSTSSSSSEEEAEENHVGCGSKNISKRKSPEGDASRTSHKFYIRALGDNTYERVDEKKETVYQCYGCTEYFGELDPDDGLLAITWKRGAAQQLCPGCCRSFIGYVSQETLNEVLDATKHATDLSRHGETS